MILVTKTSDQTRQRVCVCVCVVIPFILDVRLVDVPAGVIQEEGNTGFLHFPSAVLALFLLARRIPPFLSLVDLEVEFCDELIISACWPFFFLLFFCGEKPLTLTLIALQGHQAKQRQNTR